MNTHFTYFLILGLSLAGPLMLSFDSKVAFYKKWKYLFPAMATPFFVYTLWDVFFTKWGIWWFNEKYITGRYLLNLPVEEVLFFVIVPYCCVFIYECVCCYFPNKFMHSSWTRIHYFLSAILVAAGLSNLDLYYTSFTFLGAGSMLAALIIFKKNFTKFYIGRFLVSYLLCLLPFLLVNGFLTALPVVEYDDSQNLGIRIHTIPFEDIFYGMLLMLMIIADYERRKNKAASSEASSQ